MRLVEQPIAGRFVYEYDRKSFPLTELVTQMLSVSPDDLPKLHTRAELGLIKTGQEHTTPFHKSYYRHSES